MFQLFKKRYSQRNNLIWHILFLADFLADSQHYPETFVTMTRARIESYLGITVLSVKMFP